MEHPVLTIRELRVRAVRVPMAEPHRTASGTIVESPLVLVDVLTDQGVVGHSYIFCYAAFALAPTARLVKDLGPLIAGQPVAPLVIAELLGRKFRLLGRQGLAAWRSRRSTWPFGTCSRGRTRYRCCGCSGPSRGRSRRTGRSAMTGRPGPRSVLGAWAVIAAWPLGYVSHATVVANVALVAIVVAVLALGAMHRDGDFDRLRHKQLTA